MNSLLFFVTIVLYFGYADAHAATDCGLGPVTNGEFRERPLSFPFLNPQQARELACRARKVTDLTRLFYKLEEAAFDARPECRAEFIALSDAIEEFMDVRRLVSQPNKALSHEDVAIFCGR